MAEKQTSESPMARTVNQVFVEAAREDPRVMIEIAAFALGKPLVELAQAKKDQFKAFEEYTKNTPKAEKSEGVIFGMEVLVSTNGELELSSEPSDVEKAENGLIQAKKDIRSTYNLTRFEAALAHFMSRKTYL